jgi:Fe-S cluster biogenesis protein NfuA
MIRAMMKSAVKKALGIDSPERGTYTAPPPVAPPPAPVISVPDVAVVEAKTPSAAPTPAPEQVVAKKPAAKKAAAKEAVAKKPAAKKAVAKKPAAKKAVAKKPAAKKAVAKKPAAKKAVAKKPAAKKAVAKKVAPPPEPAESGGISMGEIQEVFDEMVRPALQADGGDITLIKIEKNDIYVRLVGACNTCPSSIMTMKLGVEALLKEEFPTMGELIQMDPGLIA